MKFVLDMFFNIGIYGRYTPQFVRISIEFVLGVFVLSGEDCVPLMHYTPAWTYTHEDICIQGIHTDTTIFSLRLKSNF